jgi:TonB family protein
MAKNVLLIEYEQRDRSRILSLLAPAGYAVTETHDGEEGLAAFGPGSFDLVLLSGKLPRLSPTDVIRDIRKKGGLAAPPIVLLTAGYSGSNTKADAQKIGAFEIVPKPFADEALLGAVRSALESTDRQAKTMKIPVASNVLTAKDIFSDLIEELGREPQAAAPKIESPKLPRAAASADEEIERRLRDTLSGVSLPPRPRHAAPPIPAPEAIKSPEMASRRSAARSSDADAIDRMLSETLRIPVGKKPVPSKEAGAGPQGLSPRLSDSGAGPQGLSPRGTDATPTPSRRAEPREAVAPSGPDRFGQYELLERIASGGMAELFRARRSGVEGFQKIVAIKKILPHIADNDEFITMLADEAKVAAQLNHPNIVHIYDLGKIESGGYFIAMEYVEGTDLRTVLRSGREIGLSLPIPLAVYVASKVASALDYAHRRRDSRGEELRIVHRDVSPQNILISHEGEIKLCDFGIAKADRKVSRTESGSLKGKLQYMSPEQAWGKPIDHRSDLFSLGTVLHEMLTGERLFRGDSDMTVLELVRKADVPPPSRLNPDVPVALDQIVMKALAREPEDRYGTGSELLRDLESILYSYTPAPGSADVAIYLNRLRETRAASPAGEVSAPPRTAPPEKPARRPTGAPVPPVALDARGPATPAPTPVPSPEAAPETAPEPAEVFGSFSAARVDSERKGRLPLYAGLAAVVVIGGALALVLGRKGAAPSPPAAPTPAAAQAIAPPAAEPLPAPAGTPVVASASLDPKVIQQEVQRQLAQKRQEMKPSPVSARATPVPVRASQVPAAIPPTEVPPARPEPTLAPPPPTEAPPEPTEVAVAPAPAAREPAEPAAERESVPAPAPGEAAPAAEEVSRGDLVGPGPGVVEPVLIAPPRVSYPPIARQQRISGRVVVLVLVTEDGVVAQARIQSGVGGRSGLDGAVRDAVRSSRFRPATKNGIPVKMWRTVVVDVKP